MLEDNNNNNNNLSHGLITALNVPNMKKPLKSKQKSKKEGEKAEREVESQIQYYALCTLFQVLTCSATRDTETNIMPHQGFFIFKFLLIKKPTNGKMPGSEYKTTLYKTKKNMQVMMVGTVDDVMQQQLQYMTLFMTRTTASP